MLVAAITLPGGADGVWPLVFVPASIAIAALGGVIGILASRRQGAADSAPSRARTADRDG
jgi:hypothetical protein